MTKKQLGTGIGIAAALSLGLFTWAGIMPMSILSAMSGAPQPEASAPAGKLPSGSPMPASAAELSGTWVWQGATVGGQDVILPSEPGAFTLTFGMNGQVSGTTDCNQYGATSQLGSDGVISVNSLYSTKMFCEGAQETEYTGLLSAVTRQALDPSGNLMMLVGEGEAILYFTRQ
jgi:heat shock protein HslJ